MKIEILSNEDEAIKVCNALCVPSRLTILRHIAKKPKFIVQIAEELNMTVAAVALNMNILEEAGLVEIRYEPGDRGTRKMCKLAVAKIVIEVIKQ